jgi:hypothetical protein
MSLECCDRRVAQRWDIPYAIQSGLNHGPGSPNAVMAGRCNKVLVGTDGQSVDLFLPVSVCFPDIQETLTH